ncbi:uncharacterized protein LOC117582539 [Drosophila guanche]|uniref:Uncharacterized protein n=1 Tax=Drosophila guanche TaxID=7266 RepID=A0A3B0K7J8_DROGU|nr:uncharacterized protein LOC117582539 [Drosophila guanche]SPP79498.1 Hypothetical predicted protein [Drosophila guanche]
MPHQQKSSVFYSEANDCMAGLKTTTQDALESGAKKQTARPEVLKKIVHFRSFKSNQYSADETFVPQDKDPLVSSYSKDYSWTGLGSKFRKCVPVETSPDPDFCRRQVNPFYSITSSPFKFMDDHLNMELVTEHRKKIDFFRQLRNQSQIFTDS